MPNSIYLINPANDFPTYFGAEVFAAWGLAPATGVADPTITTVAALVPDDFSVSICDEHLEPVDFDTRAEIIGITGKVSQWNRMRAIADEFRARGKTVVIGGPYATLSPDVVRDHCDVLVRGEAEEIAEQLFTDLRGSKARSEYVGSRPSLDLTPLPRWDLYPNERAEWGNVQTSRGCPFNCEFCDVIPYLGRNQRHKSIANVLAETDELYRLGYRRIFLADDNLTAYRKRAKELLVALADWNDRQTDGRVFFATQVSVDVARDAEMLRLCSAAGLGSVFIGLETPNADSLRLANKKHNVGVDLVAQVHRFYDHGILVTGGMICGFDADGPDIFQRQLDFATQAAMPIVTLGSLVAPPATLLHARLREEGRLVERDPTNPGTDDRDLEAAATPWASNIVPKLLTRDELFAGVRWLADQLYAPEAFGQRMLRFLELQGPRVDQDRANAQGTGPLRPIDQELGQLIDRLARMGPAEGRMVAEVTTAMASRPETVPIVVACLRIYAQIRHMYAVELSPREASPSLRAG